MGLFNNAGQYAIAGAVAAAGGGYIGYRRSKSGKSHLSPGWNAASWATTTAPLGVAALAGAKGEMKVLERALNWLGP